MEFDASVAGTAPVAVPAVELGAVPEVDEPPEPEGPTPPPLVPAPAIDDPEPPLLPAPPAAVPPASPSQGTAPAVPVASSAVNDSTAQPLSKLTLRVSWVDKFFGEPQLPVSQLLARAVPLKSSRQLNVNAPSA